jgi:DNA-binding MarR family transcriptional regulator
VKKLLLDFNKAFESKVRLGIMSVLMVNDEADFNTLKELLNLSDGNLASHIKALEELKYINVNKQFIGRKPNTNYSATKEGKKAFNAHLKSLENLIKSQTH